MSEILKQKSTEGANPESPLFSHEQVEKALLNQENIISTHFAGSEYSQDFLKELNRKMMRENLTDDMENKREEVRQLLSYSYAFDVDNPCRLTFKEHIPREFAGTLSAYLKQNPALCVGWQLPEYPDSTIDSPPTITSEMLDDLIQLSQHSQALEQWQNQREAEARIMKVNFSRKMQRFLDETFGYSKELTGDTAEQIHRKLHDIKSTTNEVAYWSTILHEAARELLELAPSLRPIIPAILENTLIMRESKVRVGSFISIPRIKKVFRPLQEYAGENISEDMRQNGEFTTRYGNEWKAGKVGQIFQLWVKEAAFSVDDVKKDYEIRKTIVLHELLHLITDRFLSATANVESISRLDSEKMHPSSLYVVIQEGVSLAFELEYLRTRLEGNSLDETERTQLTEYRDIRMRYLRNGLEMWKPLTRIVLLGVPANEVPEIAYAEGARLALHFKNQGWTTNDLPDLLAQLKVLLNEELRIDNFLIARTIPVTKNSQDEGEDQLKYVQIRQKMRKMRPSREIS